MLETCMYCINSISHFIHQHFRHNAAPDGSIIMCFCYWRRVFNSECELKWKTTWDDDIDYCVQSKVIELMHLNYWIELNSSEIFILLCRFLESSILTTFIMWVIVWRMIMMNDRHMIFCIMEDVCMSTLKKGKFLLLFESFNDDEMQNVGFAYTAMVERSKHQSILSALTQRMSSLSSIIVLEVWFPYFLLILL